MYIKISLILKTNIYNDIKLYLYQKKWSNINIIKRIKNKRKKSKKHKIYNKSLIYKWQQNY